MNDDQWKGVINFLNEKFDEHGLFRKAWSAQTEANLPLIKKENSLRAATEHMLLDKERAVVIVGASPRLKEDVEKLKALDENFVLVCANSAVKYLLDHGIRPDYVISIDADDVIAKRDLENFLQVVVIATVFRGGFKLVKKHENGYFAPVFVSN
jgi:hypothetical protein